MTKGLHLSAAEFNRRLGAVPAASRCPMAKMSMVVSGFTVRFGAAKDYLSQGGQMEAIKRDLAKPDLGLANNVHEILAQEAIDALKTKDKGLALFWIAAAYFLNSQWNEKMAVSGFGAYILQALTPRQRDSAEASNATPLDKILHRGISSGAALICDFMKLLPKIYQQAKSTSIDSQTYSVAVKNLLGLLMELKQVNLLGLVQLFQKMSPLRHVYKGQVAGIDVLVDDFPEYPGLVVWNDQTGSLDLNIEAMAADLAACRLDLVLNHAVGTIPLNADKAHGCPGSAFIPLMHQEMLDLFNLHVFPYLDEVLMIDTKKKELEADPQQGLTVLKTRIDRLLDGSKRIVESGPKELTKIAARLREQIEAALKAKDTAGFAKAKDLNQLVADFFECEINHFMMQHFKRANEDLAVLIAAKEKAFLR